jgi:uncharacterized coiled-coil protein SlyX
MRGQNAGPTAGGRLAAVESRLTDLEVRYTHLERQVAELSDVVFAQQKVIDGLVRQLTATEAEIAQLAPQVTNEKPPHY